MTKKRILMLCLGACACLLIAVIVFTGRTAEGKIKSCHVHGADYTLTVVLDNGQEAAARFYGGPLKLGVRCSIRRSNRLAGWTFVQYR